MVKTEPVVEKRLSFTVVGVTYETTLPQVIEQDLGKNAYNTVLARREDFEERESDAVILVLVYPMKPGFNPHVDPISYGGTQMIIQLAVVGMIYNVYRRKDMVRIMRSK